MNIEKKTPTIEKYNDYPYIVYVRVSTGRDQQKDSVSNQIDICRYWLEQNKYEWKEKSILKDEGKSGTLFLERNAMQLILKKARNREIKMVVFKSIHRLARDLKDSLEIKEVLLGHGVRVVTIEEGYDSLYEGKNDMKFEMYSMFAAQYPKTTSVSISAVLAAKVRRGHHIGKTPYGYKKVNQELVIDEDEARVVRQIFDWYNYSNFGYKTITHLLNDGIDEGSILPPRNKGYWQVTSIQRIIKNSTFSGTFILNQYTHIKIDGRKKQIRNPKEKWTIFEKHHPAIVSKKEWEKANNKAVINTNTKVTVWNEFRGLIKCAECNSNMIIMQSWKKKKDGTKTNWKYFKCSAYRRSGVRGCVNHIPITYDQFREFVLKKLLAEGDQIKLKLNNNLVNDKKEKIKVINKKVANEKVKKKRLIDLYLDQIIDDKVEFENKKNAIENEIESLNDELFLLSSEESNEIDINNIKLAFDAIENTKTDLHFAFKSLIEHLMVYQDGKVDLKYTFTNDENSNDIIL